MTVSELPSPYVHTDNIYLGIGSGVSPSGKELFTRLTIWSPCDLSICNFSYFPFWFRGLDIGLILSVPAYCLSIFFLRIKQQTP